MAGKGVNGNLIPGDQRSSENNRANGKRGGIASGEAKRRKKATRELIKMVLSSPVEPPAKARKVLKKVGYDVDEQGPPSVELLMQLQIATQAMSGDLASAKFLYDYAQVPDLKAALERERLKAARKDAPEAAALRQAREILGGVDSAIK